MQEAVSGRRFGIDQPIRYERCSQASGVVRLGVVGKVLTCCELRGGSVELFPPSSNPDFRSVAVRAPALSFEPSDL